MSESRNQQSGPRRLRLKGARFEGGRLPVDSLVELQSYQKIIRIAAEAEWRRDHPEEKLPEELRDSIRLTIERIDDGSAEIYLAYEQHAEYVDYQREAQNTTDAVLVAAYEQNIPPELSDFPPEMSYEYREAVSELGVTLVEHQSIEVYIGEAPVTITPRSRKRALELLSPIDDFLLEPDFEEVGTGLETVPDVSLVGRVTVLDTDHERFVITLGDGAKVHGWYRQSNHLLDDLRKVVHSSEKGALTRIAGDLQYEDGNPFRFKEAHSVERVEFDKTAWGFRLTEFASLTPGWDDDEGRQITSSALDAAQMLLRAVDDAHIIQPGIFPTEEGGVLIEWASPVRVRSVEVTPEGTFELFALYPEQREAEHDSTADLTKAIAFVEVEKA